jgi:hypothetical protein
VNSSLTLAYEFSRDGDDFGWLEASLSTPDFSARNGMWVQWQDLTSFAEELLRYPLTRESPAEAEWAVGEDGRTEAITRIVVAPAGSTGALVCFVYLANYYENADRCQVRFGTDYPSLARFADALGAMMRKEVPSAVLTGERGG